MTVFWIIAAGFVFGILLLAFLIEYHGGRTGFQGANGIFIVASGAVAIFSLPIVFGITWIWADLWTAVRVCATGAVAYAALFFLALNQLTRLGQALSSRARQR